MQPLEVASPHEKLQSAVSVCNQYFLSGVRKDRQRKDNNIFQSTHPVWGGTAKEEHRMKWFEKIYVSLALGLVIALGVLCIVGTIALHSKVKETQDPAPAIQEDDISAALSEVYKHVQEPMPPEEDPGEPQKSLEAIKAKCQMVEDCYIVGYAPELVEGWRSEWKNENGLYLTASGMWGAPGYTVATDPDVIPTGATVIIGDQVYIAADRGVNGKVIDIMMSPGEALVYGCHRADVYWCM